MSHHEHGNDDVKLLRDKLKGIHIAMMTTQDPDGSLHSRPMATQDMEDDGVLWFLTQGSAPKAGAVERHQQINLSYCKPEDNLFVSISGNAELVHDRKKIKDMWKPFFKAWFPKGEDDPDLALLKVHVEKAEYWDAPSGKMGALYSVVKGLATGGKEPGGENVKLDMK